LRVTNAIRRLFGRGEARVAATGAADSWQDCWASAEASAKAGDLDTSIRWYSRTIELKSDHVAAYYKRGNLLIATRQFEEALASYDEAIKLNPEYAKAFCNRGVALEHLGRLEQAQASYTRAIALTPEDAFAFYNRATVHRALGRTEDALSDYATAIKIKPDYAEAHFNRALLLQHKRLFDAALAGYDQTIELNPGRGDAHSNRAIVLMELHRWEAALVAFNRALSLMPDSAEAYCNRGRLLALLGQYEDGIADFDRAVTLRDDYAYAFYRRADALNHQQRFSEAIKSYDRAIALNPGFHVLRGMRRFAQMKICDWNDLEADVTDFTSAIEKDICVSPPLPLLGLLTSPRLHYRATVAWCREQCPPDNALGAIRSHARGEKILVGYFSADFRDHAVAQMTAALFEAHDRSKFHVTAFAFGPNAKDAMRERLERTFDRFIDVSDRPDLEVASLARELQIDIAVDLGGFTAHSRPGIFALRAAPIQINYLGYPGTMGAPYMDYIIADRVVIPEVHRKDYAENIIYLPETYFPCDSTRQIADKPYAREDLGLPSDAFVFCCFNNNYKITPDIFAIWMRILRRVDGSILWLSRNGPEATKNLREAAKGHGVDPERLVFADRITSLSDHLARYRAADLFLDTRPYNAHATAVDALWAGLPVLTCAGDGFASRVAASLLTAIRLPELVTESLDAYENLAVSLAIDPSRLVRLKEALTDNLGTAPLFDVHGYTKHLEAGYSVAFGRLVDGLAPADIVLDERGANVGNA
jgi:predicted O-linked N-acetylglucosamine transferase (SPINDLY family)